MSVEGMIMSWNGSSNQNKKDPWGGRDPKAGPPDLDALLRKLRQKFSSVFTKKKPEDEGNSRFNNKIVRDKSAGWWTVIILVGLLLIWFLSGIFIVSPAERAVVLRFGSYVTTVGSGPHWIPSLIDSKYVVNVQKVETFTYASDMLTSDENIVNVTVSVQYRVDNPRAYLFNIVSADDSLQQATASALRQVIGHSTLDDILTTGRVNARVQVAKQLQELLVRYRSGLIATDVTLQSVKPPEAVTAAFDDVVKAREDRQSYIYQANAYANQVIASAQGHAARILQEGQAYKQSAVLEAQAVTASYLALLPQYQKAPDITRERLYLSTMQTILSNSTTIFVDTTGNNNLLYLPLDKLMNQAADNKGADNKMSVMPSSNTSPSQNASTSDLILNRPAYPTRGDS